MAKFELLTGANLVLKSKCTVHIDNKVEIFDDFVAIGYEPKNGNLTMMHNADTITLALALEMTKKAFLVSYDNLSAEHKKIVDDFILGGNKLHEKD